MIIKSDEEAKKAIMYIIDLSMKRGLFGVTDAVPIANLVQSIEIIKKPKKASKRKVP